MKRKLLVFLVVAVAAVAFEAGSALAANLNYNPGTGELTYVTNDVGDQPFLDNKVHVRPVTAGQWSGVALGDEAWSLPNTARANVFLNADAEKACVYSYQGYDSEYWCAATKVTVKTGKGDDDITVSQDLKIPTLLEGGPGIDWIQGGGGKDDIWGGCSNGDAICNGFKDTLHGGDGNDGLHGGAAVDYLAGDAGDDLLDGGLGGDQLYGGSGSDLADYSKRTGQIAASLDGAVNDGQAGEYDFIAADVEGIQGGSAKDTLSGNDSANTLFGGPGDDYLVGYGGPDDLRGGTGSDLLRPGFGPDVALGGSEPAGSCCKLDTVTYGERWDALSVSLDGLANDGELGENDNVASDVESVTGGGGNDTLSGDQHQNVLIGGLGDDTLDGNGPGGTLEAPAFKNPDKLYGEGGNDVLNGGPAGSTAEVLDGGVGTDLVTYASRMDGVTIRLDGQAYGAEDTIANVENARGGEGNDKLVGSEGPNAFFANGGNDIAAGNGGDDSLYGMNGNDNIDGGAGNDIVAGGDGADMLTGGAGADWMAGYGGLDTVSYANSTVPISVVPDGVANDGAAGEGDNVGSTTENIVGGHAADKLTGTADPNTLTGGDGADTLNGLGGADLLDGGPKNDILNGGDGPDTLDGGSENDQLFGDGGYDTLRGGLGSDALHGGADGDTADYSKAGWAVTVNLVAKSSAGADGADTLFDSVENVNGSNYNDTLTGDGGPNTLSGFGGNDTIVGGGGNDHLFGAAGNDTLRGEAGDDELNGGEGIDTATYANAAGAVVVDLSFYNASATGSAGTDWLSLVENVTGSGYADSITGSAEANVLLGGGGNDTLLGLGGNDKLDGQVGVDSVDGGLNLDTCLAETKANCEQ
jgi:Ca2+-binding RTX toxin-like protein